ncbi:hypothetical protein GCM10010306_086120 [Streptomyces umbrinus]|nr:hypothetical protein GCM10010306_086120 [Streptomyces umbrinus]
MGAGGSRTCPGPAVGAQTLTLDARVKGKTAAAVRPATRWRFPPSGVPRVSAVPLVCSSRQEHWWRRAKPTPRHEGAIDTLASHVFASRHAVAGASDPPPHRGPRPGGRGAVSDDRLTTRFLAPPVNSLAVQACCVRNPGRWVPAPARALTSSRAVHLL